MMKNHNVRLGFSDIGYLFIFYEIFISKLIKHHSY